MEELRAFGSVIVIIAVIIVGAFTFAYTAQFFVEHPSASVLSASLLIIIGLLKHYGMNTHSHMPHSRHSQ